MWRYQPLALVFCLLPLTALAESAEYYLVKTEIHEASYTSCIGLNHALRLSKSIEKEFIFGAVRFVDARNNALNALRDDNLDCYITAGTAYFVNNEPDDIIFYRTLHVFEWK